MRVEPMAIVPLICLTASSLSGARAQSTDVPITIRPGALASVIDEVAGRPVTVPYARVVGVFNPRVFVMDSVAMLRPIVGNRGRILVLIQPGALNVAPALLVGSTVRISGTARTLLGVQVTREVAWPSELTPELVERLEIRAAVLASSVRTADGVELTSRGTERP